MSKITHCYDLIHTSRYGTTSILVECGYTCGKIFKNEERDSIPEKETIWKKTFNTRILDERKTELDQSIRRSASDVAIAEKR